MSEDNGIQNSGLSQDEFVSAVKSAFQQPNAALKSFESQLIGVGKGFHSHIIKIQANWDNAPNIPASLVLKVPTGQKLSAAWGHIEKATEETKKTFAAAKLEDLECSVYEVFKADPPPFPVPKIFFTQKPEPGKTAFIMMEDLSGNMSLVDMATGFTAPQLESIFLSYADISAYMLKHKDVFNGLPDPMSHLRGANMAERLKATWPRLEEIEPFFKGKLDWILPHASSEARDAAIQKCKDDFKIPEALIHGDFHGYNIVLDATGDRMHSLVDWQGARNTIFLVDWCRLLDFGVDADIRREILPKCIKIYHDRLTEIMGSVHVTFTVADVESALKLLWPGFVGTQVMAIPAVMDGPMLDALGMKGEEKERAQKALLQRAKGIIEDCKPQ